MGSMVRRGHIPRHVFALLNINYDTKNPLNINRHLKACGIFAYSLESLSSLGVDVSSRGQVFFVTII